MVRRRSATVRLRFVALAIGTIVAGLTVHWGGRSLPFIVRDVLGDALWAMMIVWWLGALAPAAKAALRALVAIGVCWAVELSQLYHAPLLDAWRGTPIGQLILGSGFDTRDLAAYAVGVVIAFVLELAFRRTTSTTALPTERS